MPNSDLRRTERLGWAYWAGLASACGLILALACLNMAVDPLGVFGQDGAHTFNRVTPPSVAAYLERGPPVGAHRIAIRQSASDIFLIGSSRAARGFDTCGHPEIMRLAGSAWGVREIAATSRMVVEERRRPATLLMEVGLPIDGGGVPQDPWRATVNAALAPRVTLLSLETVASNLFGAEASRGLNDCRAKPTPPANWRAAEENFKHRAGLIDLSLDSRQRGSLTLRAMVDALDQTCRRSGLSHTVAFFALPPTPPNIDAAKGFAQQFAQSSRETEQLLREPRPPGGCRFLFIDLVSTQPGSARERLMWADRAEWFDYTHFSPRLGAVALDALLAATSSATPLREKASPTIVPD